ncbi:MAG: hypothetical protein ACI91G_000894 [Gammaproteobacteria bacterium]
MNRDGQWQLIDNQIMPIRNAGPHSVELAGVGERLASGEQLGVLFYGRQEQFLATGADNTQPPTFVPVTIRNRKHAVATGGRGCSCRVVTRLTL